VTLLLWLDGVKSSFNIKPLNHSLNLSADLCVSRGNRHNFDLKSLGSYKNRSVI